MDCQIECYATPLAYFYCSYLFKSIIIGPPKRSLNNRGNQLRIFRYFICMWLGSSVIGNIAVAEEKSSQDIRLVLQITVDGLRADLLNRYANSFGKRGFRYLMQNGTVYTNAQYQHANTETIVGHTTLATGTFPAQHGMIGNVWFDRDAGELAYNIEDADSPILPTREQSSSGEQVDPAQKLARTKGRSPSVFLVPTFGDGLRHTTEAAPRFLVYPARTAVPWQWPVKRAKRFGTPRIMVISSPAAITTMIILTGQAAGMASVKLKNTPIANGYYYLMNQTISLQDRMIVLTKWI